MTKSTEELIKKLSESDQDVYWLGGASKASIDELERLLDAKLPSSFKDFLSKVGGGGLPQEEISGIEDNDASLQYRGTVYGDTLLAREQYGLSGEFVVIYLGSDDVVWCLDTSHYSNGECPVVSFDVFSRKTSNLAENFEQFLCEFLSLRLAR